MLVTSERALYLALVFGRLTYWLGVTVETTQFKLIELLNGLSIGTL